MKGSTRREESISPQLLDLFQTRDINDNNVKQHRSQSQRHVETSSSSSPSSDERVLELRLGLAPPVVYDLWPLRHDRLLSLGHSPSSSIAAKTTPSFLISDRNISNNNNNNNINMKKKPSSSIAVNPAVTNNSSQKRTAPASVVGWPPIRSFRKNLAKQPTNENDNNNKNIEMNSDIMKNNGLDKSIEEINSNNINNIKKGMFVKINMEGVPIGRKVDLKAFDTYDKLSSAVDQLFRGLLAAQRDLNGNNSTGEKEEKIISGLMDGSGEYTLVYEDNEGDRMLVGDVPWNMFVSTVKRLRVLKSSELSLVRGKQGQMK